MMMKDPVRDLGYALALAALGAPLLLPSSSYGKSTAIVASIKQAVADPLSLLAARSPGGRGGAHLVSTKHRRAAAATAVPEEFMSPHAAAPAFVSPPPQNRADESPVSLPPLAEAPFRTSEKAPVLQLPEGPVGGPRAGGWSVPIIPIGYGGPVGTDPSRPISRRETVLLPAVPELSSWIMLIAGFFLTGGLIRTRRLLPGGTINMRGI